MRGVHAMSKRPTFEEFEKEALKDPAFKAECEALRPEFELLMQRIKERQDKQIAKKKLKKVE